MTLQGLLLQGVGEAEPLRSPPRAKRAVGQPMGVSWAGWGLGEMGTLLCHPLRIQAAARLLFGTFPLHFLQHTQA